MKKITVLHLVGSLEDAGGILSVIRQLQVATESLGCQHSVLVHRRYVEQRRPALDYRYSRFICSEMASSASMFWRACLATLETRSLLAHEHFDLVHAHSRCGFLMAFGLATWMQRTVLFTNHDYAKRKGMYRAASRRPRFHTVLLTPNMAQHYGLVEQPPKVNIISACCGDPFFAEPLPAFSAKPRRENGRVRLVCVGSMVRWKKWHLLFDALLALDDETRAKLEVSIHGPIVQTEPDSVAYEREIRERHRDERLQHCVSLPGPSNSVAELLRIADWFVLPSTNEPCSVALMEALALGVPSLVSASGGSIDIVTENGSGLFFEPDNANDLAQKLRMIASAHHAPWLAERIRESVRHRSASAVGAQYLALYRSLLDR